MVVNPKPSSELNLVSEAEHARHRQSLGISGIHFQLYDSIWCKDMTVLELGAGMGRGARKMAETASAVVAVERNTESIIYCNSSPMAGVQYAHIDIFDFARVNPDLKFDICVCLEVIEHVDDFERLLDVIIGFTNGTAYVSTIINEGGGIHSPDAHVREWSKQEFRDLLRSRWKNVVFHELASFQMGICQDPRKR